MGGRDVGEVPGRTWRKGHTAGGDDGRRSGRKHDSGVDLQRWECKLDASEQSCRHRIGFIDSARGEHGAVELHAHDTTERDDLRIDGMGVGDIGEVPGGTRQSRHEAGGDDGRGAGRERDEGMVDRCTRAEHGGLAEPCRHRIGINHGAWGEHGACGVHGATPGVAHGMRGDGVGVRDFGQVFGGAWCAWHEAGGDDGRGARGERDAGVVIGRWRAELAAGAEPGGDGLGINHGARGEHGACDIHGAGTSGGHGMRGDGVGVGDVGEVPGGSGAAGD